MAALLWFAAPEISCLLKESETRQTYILEYIWAVIFKVKVTVNFIVNMSTYVVHAEKLKCTQCTKKKDPKECKDKIWLWLYADVFCIFCVSFWSKFWSFCCSRTFVWVISRVKWKKSVLNSVCNPFLLIFLNFLALLFIVWCNRIHSSLFKQMLYDPDLYFIDTPVFQFRWLVLMESLMLI